MAKQAILAIGYGGVDFKGYYDEVRKNGFFVTLHQTNPYFDSIIDYGENIHIILTGAETIHVHEIIAKLKEKGFEISLDILICSYIEGVINNVNHCLDTTAESKVDVFNSYVEFIEMLSGLDLSGFTDVNIIDSNNEGYDPAFDMGRALEYLNLVFDNNDPALIADKLKAVIARFASITEPMPKTDFYKLYSEISQLIEYSEAKDITLE